MFIYLKKGAAKWLGGTHHEYWWVQTEGNRTYSEREILSTNWTYMLEKSLDNLHKCTWFGLFEHPNRSLIMFEYQIGLNI